MAPPFQSSLFFIDGIHCAGCGNAIAACLERLSGIEDWTVDVVRGRLQLQWSPAQIDLEQIRKALQGLGYDIRALSSNGLDSVPLGRTALSEQPGTVSSGFQVHAQGTKEKKADVYCALQRMLIALLCMMQVMMLSVPVYMAQAGEITPDILSLLRWAQALLTLPVITFCALPIYQSAWQHLRHGWGMHRIGMDLPIALGLLIAFAASAYATLRGAGEIYFDSVTMFCALLLSSRWLQERGLAQARSYLDQLAQTQMPLANKLLAYPDSLETCSVPSAELKAGDLIWVRSGETFPVDGTVVHGISTVSEALISGESRPINKAVNDRVLASAVNLEQALIVRVERTGAQTVFAAIAALAEQAGRARPELVKHADRAAQTFMRLMLLIVVVAALGWWFVDPVRVVPVIVSILIVTCPCALSLAVPVALTAAQASLARQGVLVTKAAAIETLGRVDLVVFDKTGTLTEGIMRLEEVQLLRATNSEIAIQEATQQAAALEQTSNHPIAHALRKWTTERAAAQNQMPGVGISELKLQTGAGVEGLYQGLPIRLGQLEYALAVMPDALRAQARVQLKQLMQEKDAVTFSVLADLNGPIALFIFADQLRQDSASLIDRLRQRGLELQMLSGDHAGAVAAVARRLGLDDAQAAQQPEQKRDQVRRHQANGQVVAMIGDGINDAPVIAQADVSMAFASASTLAQTQADFILLSSRLSEIGTTFDIAARTTTIIRQNLTWALAYNLIAIPVAATGHLPPLWAGVGMVLSSLLVLANALRLLPQRQSVSTIAETAAPTAVPVA